MITLRPYQQADVDALRGAMQSHRRVLLTEPTGAGKTTVFSYIAHGAHQKGKRVLIVAHRRELIAQISTALSDWNAPHGIIESGKTRIPDQNVLVGNVFTIVRRLDHLRPPHLIICDEAHHLTPDTTFGRVAAAYPEARLLGVTATPCRSDGRGLRECFDILIHGPSVAELMALGFLTPTEVYAPSVPDLAGVHRRMGDYVVSELEDVMTPRITGSALEHYKKICPSARALAFCVSVKHAKAVADEFNAHGVPAVSVDGSMHELVRDDALNGLKDGRYKVVTSCDLISEGFDAPVVDCAILLRPTQSLGLHLQQCGRAIRLAPGKTKTIILDHAGNTAMHGFIEEPREWTLEGIKKKRGEKPPSIRTCPKCFAAHRPAPVCPMCAFVYEIQSREVEYVEGDLVKIDPKDIKLKDIENEPKKLKEYQYLVRLGEKKGYKPGWAWHVMAAKEAKRRMKEVKNG